MSSLGLTANVVVLLLGAATVVAGLRSASIWRWINLCAWLVTVGGFALLQFADAPLAVAVATVAAAGLATLRCITDDPSRRRRILSFGAAAPMALAVVGILCVREASTPWGDQVVLYTAAWAALAAGLSTLLAAASVAKRPVGSGAGIAAAGAAVALLVAGTGRSSLSEAFYGFPLRTDEGPLWWTMPPMPGFEQGLRLSAAAPLPNIFWLIAFIALASAAAGVLSWTRLRKVAAACWGACALAAVGLLASLQPTIAGLSMPVDTPYVEHVKRLLLTRNVADRVGTSGSWSSPGEVFVATADLAPEIFAMTLIALIALCSAYFSLRPEEVGEGDTIDPHFSRDHTARGLGFAWIAWFLSAIVHDALYGSPGVGAPGEWTLLGLLIGGTGLMVAGWHRDNSLFRVLSELTAGLVVAALLLVAGFAWRFGSLPGFTIGVF